MRRFDFKAKIIGDEKYLTYTMGEETELDEDVLDYCEENKLKELVEIIYEEDDDYDYLTYDISGKKSLEDMMSKEASVDKVLLVLRNIANALISLKEQAVKLNYVLLNRNFIYVDDSCEVKFICLPVESDGAVITEFKSFMRQYLANMKYDVDEDLNYVGKLLTYINGDNFNLRGLIGLTEALMEEAGVSFEEAGGIEADGVEIMNSEEAEIETESVKDFMSSLSDVASEKEEPLPEIGDDDEEEITEVKADASADAEVKKPEAKDDDDLESILPAGVAAAKPEEDEHTVALDDAPEKAPEPIKLTKPEEKITDEEVLKNRIKAIAGDNTVKPTLKQESPVITDERELDEFLGSKPPVIKKNAVKVNRAAIIQNIAASEEEAAASAEENAVSEVQGGASESKVPIIEEISDDMNVEKKKPKSNSILSKTVEGLTKQNTTNIANIAKAIPYLVRVNTKEIIMLGKETFKIGKASRGVDYTVGGNGAISRVHAIIVRRDDVSYIKDNKSTNHTYVNDQVVEDGEEAILTHDSKVRLGDEEFVFKIR